MLKRLTLAFVIAAVLGGSTFRHVQLSTPIAASCDTSGGLDGGHSQCSLVHELLNLIFPDKLPGWLSWAY